MSLENEEKKKSNFHKSKIIPFFLDIKFENIRITQFMNFVEGITFDDVLLIPGKCSIDYEQINLS